MLAASISSQKNDRPSCKGRGVSPQKCQRPRSTCAVSTPLSGTEGLIGLGSPTLSQRRCQENRRQLFPSLGLGRGSSEAQVATACPEPARGRVPAVGRHNHPPLPSSPQATPPLPPLPPRISGVPTASRTGGEGASLESEDWSLQPPLVRMESSLLLASSSPLRCLVSPFIVSCRRARVRGWQRCKGGRG